MAKLLKIYLAVLLCGVLVHCEDKIEDKSNSIESRTFAHHAMKRLSILLPAFMFKLGIMFTMILVSMITSTKGLLVGTLLLALGIGHFIASKFSAVPTAPLTLLPHAHSLPVHAHAPLPFSHAVPIAHAQPVAHWVDRSDNVQGTNSLGTVPSSYQTYGQYGNAQAYSSWKQ